MKIWRKIKAEDGHNVMPFPYVLCITPSFFDNNVIRRKIFPQRMIRKSRFHRIKIYIAWFARRTFDFIGTAWHYTLPYHQFNGFDTGTMYADAGIQMYSFFELLRNMPAS